MIDPHTHTGYGHYEHLKCVKTVWRLRAEISFASVEKNPGYDPVVLAVCNGYYFNEATTGRHLRPGALLIIYINIVCGAKRLWGESSMGRNAHGARRPWGETSMGRNVRGAKSPDTGQVTIACKPFPCKPIYNYKQLETRHLISAQMASQSSVPL